MSHVCDGAVTFEDRSPRVRKGIAYHLEPHLYPSASDAKPFTSDDCTEKRARSVLYFWYSWAQRTKSQIPSLTILQNVVFSQQIRYLFDFHTLDFTIQPTVSENIISASAKRLKFNILICRRK